MAYFNWWDEIAEEGTQLWDLAKELNTKALEDEQRYSNDEIGLGRLATRHLGRAGEAVGGLISGGLDLITPDVITDPLVKGMTWGTEEALDTEYGKGMLQYLSDNPKTARDITAALGVAEIGLPKALLAPVQRAISAAPNYIPNYYAGEIKNLKDTTPELAKLTETLLKYNVKGVTNLTDAHTLAQKFTGLKEWAGKVAKGGFTSVINPSARALQDKYGINKHSQKIVKDEWAKAKAAEGRGDSATASRHKEKAVAQMTYNAYIDAQTNTNKAGKGVLGGHVDSISHGGIQQLSKDNYINAANEANVTQHTRSARGVNKEVDFKTSDADLSYAYDSVLKAWGMPDSGTNRLVVKRVEGMGGDHFQDAIKNKNKAHNTLRRIYASTDTTDPMELYTILSNKLPKGVTILNKSLRDVQQNGLWLSSSHVGSAVVEGGVNVLTKVLPDKRAMSFVSDEHDFLEKLPVLGKVLKKALPRREVSITPPIYVDLAPTALKAKQKHLKGKRRTKFSRDTAQSGKVTDKQVEDYINARPTLGALVSQAVKMPAEAFYLGTALHDYEQEE
jgi:hypothetical protein